MKTRTHLIYPLFGLTIAATAWSLVNQWPTGATPTTAQQNYDRALNAVARQLANGVTTKTELIYRALSFVHDNSTHRSDEDQRRYAFNTPLVIQMLQDVHSGMTNEKPGLTCGPRALAMKAILNACGITSRLVQVYSSDYESVRGHRLLEVLNPDTGHWEVWDPDYRVVYKSTHDGIRVDITSLVFDSLDQIEPWRDDLHGWEQTGMLEIRSHYFQALLFEHMEGGMKDAVIVINSARLNQTKVFSDGNTFEQWARAHYGSPRIMVFPKNSH